MQSTLNRIALPAMLFVLAGCGGGEAPADDTARQESSPDTSGRAAPAASQEPASGTAESAAKQTFEVSLAGSGNDDGTGTANLTLNPESGEVCYDISVANIEPPTAAHIHKGAAGATGSVVVPFEPPPEQGTWQDCVQADPAVVSQIVSEPSAYYVNVHNQPYPAGAVRGQVGSGSGGS